MDSKIVLALGGNALGNNPEEQKEMVKNTAIHIVDLAQEGHKVLIVHGNGPQVGMINQAMTLSHEETGQTPAMPFPECGAMSQGYIGYHLQNAIKNELMKRDMDISVAAVISQVLVDQNDPAFDNPTKPIGDFYTEEEAKAQEEEKGYSFVEDSGRGYRRVVPSPIPQDIIEKDMVNSLLDAGYIVIAGGGGGIPVIEKEGAYQGVDAVIDKDLTSMTLAKLIDADQFLILTAVEKVYINYGKENQEALDTITVEEAREYIDQGQFAPGSMLPKVEAMISFVEDKPESKALITSLDRAKDGLAGKTGTIIVKE